MRRFWLFLVVFIAAAIVCACNVTRTITTQAECVKSGDSTQVITTKTIETYDAHSNK